MHYIRKIFIVMFLLPVVLTLTIGQPSAAGKKPNILIIWGDDSGYWNVSAYNQGMMGHKRAALF